MAPLSVRFSKPFYRIFPKTIETSSLNNFVSLYLTDNINEFRQIFRIEKIPISIFNTFLKYFLEHEGEM